MPARRRAAPGVSDQLEHHNKDETISVQLVSWFRISRELDIVCDANFETKTTLASKALPVSRRF